MELLRDAMDVMKSLIRRLFPKDNFAGNWYGWLTNQISHIALGVGIAVVVTGVCYAAAGEFPVKWAAWICAAGIYAAAEAVRGWHGWDTVEDWIFVAAYGSGGAFMAFTELFPGSPILILRFTDLPFLLGFMAAHLAVGSIVRGRDA